VIPTAVFTKLQSRLDEIADQLAEDLDPVVEQAAQRLVEGAKETTPPANDSGRLRESIRVIKYDTCRYNVIADARAPSNNLPYGIFLEYGTEARGRGGGNIAATHFMARAAEANLQEFEQMINEKLKRL
jgi:hypothetical protein